VFQGSYWLGVKVIYELIVMLGVMGFRVTICMRLYGKGVSKLRDLRLVDQRSQYGQCDQYNQGGHP
jgi:hypothetical protein